MPVKIKLSPQNTQELLSLLGLSEQAVNAALAGGVSVVKTSTKVQFIYKGTVLEAVSVKPGILNMLQQGLLQSMSLNNLQGQFSSAMKNAVQCALNTAESDLAGYTDLTLQGKKAAYTATKKRIAKLQKAMAALQAAAGPAKAPEPFLEAPVTPKAASEPLSGSPVALMDATALYQPVKGTSHGSVYYAVGIGEGLKVAARAMGTKLSMRVEGDLTGHKVALSKLGLSTASDHHASMHVEVPDLDMASRTVGAVLVGLGVEWETGMPVVKKLWQKGA